MATTDIHKKPDEPERTLKTLLMAVNSGVIVNTASWLAGYYGYWPRTCSFVHDRRR